MRQLMRTPIPTNTRRPVAPARLSTRRLGLGDSDGEIAAAAQRRVVKIPEPSPPSQALSMIAGKKKMKGSVRPQSGTMAARSARAMAVALTATA
jgi:hypothetical protein